LVFYNRPIKNHEVQQLASAADLSFLTLENYEVELAANFTAKTIQAALLPVQTGFTYTISPATSTQVGIAVNSETGLITLENISQPIAEEMFTVTATNGIVSYATQLKVKPIESYNTDLLVYYPFNGNFNDQTGSGFNGGLQPGISAPDLVEDRMGVANSAYFFNTNDRVLFGDIPLSGQSYTLAFWVKMPANLQYNRTWSFISKRAACSEGQFFDIKTNRSNTGQFSVIYELRDDGQTGGITLPIGADEWVHVAIVKDSEQSQLIGYVNGQLVGSTQWTSAFIDVENAAHFAISGSPCINNTNVFNWWGGIDELRVYNKAVSAFDLRRLVTQGIPEFTLSNNFLFLDQNFNQTTINITNQLETGVTYSLSPDPSSVNFVNVTINASTGQVTVTPVADASGTVDFTVIATKNEKSFSRNFTVKVKTEEQKGILAYYNFNGNANESFGNTQINGTASAPLTNDRKNNLQSAYYFNRAQGHYLTVPNNSIFNFDTNRNFSVSLWFKTPQSSTVQRLFIKGNDPSYRASITADGKLEWRLFYGNGVNELVTSAQRVDDNLWHHAVFTLDRTGAAKIYLNGQEVASLTNTRTGTLTTTLPLYFGEAFEGSMDDVRFFDHVISAERIVLLSEENRPTFLKVLANTPQKNSIISSTDTLGVVFNKAINTATASNVTVHGNLSGKISGSLLTTDTTIQFVPAVPFKIGETLTLTINKQLIAAMGDTLINPIMSEYMVQGNAAHEKPMIFKQEKVVDDVVVGMYYSVPGDIDNDGDVDVVGISSVEGKLTLYTNDGTGAFSQTDFNPTGLQDVHLADLNSDGRLDIVFMSGFTVSWYKNNGSLSFAGPFNITTLSTLYNAQQYRLTSGDLDSDGDIEIIPYSLSSQQGVVVVIKNNNNGQSFTAPVLAAGNDVMAVTVTDSNNDGIADLLIAKQTTLIRVRMNSSLTAAASTESIATINTVYGYGSSIDAADLDNDGDDDLLFTTWGSGNTPSGVYWKENVDGFYNLPVKTIKVLGNGINTGGVYSRIVDMDGDGDNDVVSYATTSKLFWNENLGSGVFSNLKAISANFAPLDYRHMYPGFADFNSDGLTDMLISGAGQFVIFESKDALTLLTATPTVNASGVPLDSDIVFTFDKEITPNSVAATNLTLYGSIGGSLKGIVSLSADNKTLTFNPNNNFYPGEKVTVSLPGALTDADGNVAAPKVYSFIAATEAGANEMFLTNSTQIANSLRVAVADFNKDGKIDFDIMRYATQKYYFEHNLNSGGFNFASTSNNPASALYSNSNFELADLNGDGRQDRYLVDFYNRRAIGFPTTETGATGSALYMNSMTSYSAYDFAFGDMDNDGDLDFTLGTGLGFEWHRNNNGSFASVLPNIPGEVLNDIKLADLTNDGRLDAVMWGSSNHVSFYENDNGSFAVNRQVAANVGNMSSYNFTDIDNDTDLDMVLTRTATEGIAVFTNNGRGVFAKTQNLNNAVTNSTWAEFADWNADGKPDVIAAYGSAIAWFENTGNGFAAADTLIADANALHFAVADLDGDHDLDLVFANATSYNVYSNGLPPNNAPTVTNAITNVLMTEDDQQITHVTDLNTIFTDADAHTLTFTAVSNPAGVVSEVQGNALKITPAANYFGTATVTVTANDGYENTSTTFTVEVTPVNDDPSFYLTTPQLILQEDFSGKDTVAIINTSPSNEIETVTYLLEPQINFANVSIVNDTIFIESLPNLFGEITATLTANDGEKSVSHTFYLKVEAVDDLPVVTLSKTEITLIEDFELTDTIAISFVHPTNEPAPVITFDEGYGDGINFVHFEYSSNHDSIFVTPILNGFGTDSIGVFVDGIEHKVKISVNPVNDAPAFNLEKTTLNLGKNFATTETVSATNLSPENESNQVITYSISPSTVSFANVSIDQNTGTLTISAITDQFGSAEITVTATDGEAENNSYSAIFTLSVLENQPPVITTALSNVIMNEDNQAIVIDNATAGFSDPENTGLTFTVSSGSELVVALLENNSLTLTPAANFFGNVAITVTASDGNSTTDDVFTLEVLPVNDAPEFVLSTNLVEKQQDFEGDASILVTVQNRPENEANETVTYTITPESVDFASVSIHAELGQITITSKPGLFGNQIFTVTANDGQINNNLYSTTFELRIARTNTAPTAIELSTVSISENMQENTLIGTLTSVDLEDTQFTYSLVSGEGDTDNSQFVLTNGNELRTAAVFDFETKNSYSLRIKTDDGNGGTFETALSISVTNVNETPINIALSSNTLAENSASGSVIGTLSATDPDADETFTFSISGKTESFAINNSQLVAMQSFNFETQSTHSLTITVTDNAQNTFSKTIEILIQNVNEAPTNLQLSKTSVDEKLAIGALVGELSVSDEDLNSTHTYQFVSGVAGGNPFGADNAAFQIAGNQLKTNSVFDFDVKKSFNIAIEAVDNNGLKSTFTAFTIQINNTNSTAIITTHSVEMKLYPNPTADQLTLEWASGNTPEKVSMYNQAGTCLLVENLSPNQTSVQLSTEQLASGIYFIELMIDGQRITKKFVRQ